MGTLGGRLRERRCVKAGRKISVVTREAPSKLRDNLLANSHQFDSNYNKLRAILQAHLNSNKSWIPNDFRSDTKERDPMEVDHIALDRGKGKGKGKGQRPNKE